MQCSGACTYMTTCEQCMYVYMCISTCQDFRVCVISFMMSFIVVLSYSGFRINSIKNMPSQKWEIHDNVIGHRKIMYLDVLMSILWLHFSPCDGYLNNVVCRIKKNNSWLKRDWVFVHTFIVFQITQYPHCSNDEMQQDAFNIYPSMNKKSFALLSVERNYLSIPKRQRLHRWSLEWISNFIPHYITDVIAYPYWD